MYHLEQWRVKSNRNINAFVDVANHFNSLKRSSSACIFSEISAKAYMLLIYAIIISYQAVISPKAVEHEM